MAAGRMAEWAMTKQQYLSEATGAEKRDRDTAQKRVNQILCRAKKYTQHLHVSSRSSSHA